MSFLKKLGSLLAPKGSTSQADSSGLYVYVRCQGCGEKILIRVDRRFDLLQEFDQGSDFVSSYTLHKDVLGKKCFKMMQLSMEFDAERRETSRSIDGGDFITQAEYQAPD